MTIHEALRTKLGREPTPTELKQEIARIGEEAMINRAGKLRHQKRRG